MKQKTNFISKLVRKVFKLCYKAKLPEHNFRRGSKLFNNYQRIVLIVLFIQSKKSLREFINNIDGVLTMWKLSLKARKIPSKSTLHSWLKRFPADFIRELLDYTIENLVLKVIAIDGSGIETHHKSKYYEKRQSDSGIGKPKRKWHKLDIVVDVKSKNIIDFSFSTQQKHDSKFAWQFLKKRKFKNTKILADKGYYWFNLFDLAKQSGNELIVPPKNYEEKCVHDNFKRQEFQDCFYRNKGIYFLRNNVESVFSSLKRVQGLVLRSRLPDMKNKEIAWHILWYNIRRGFVFVLIRQTPFG